MYRQGCNREYSIQIQHCAYLSAAMQHALLFPFLSRFGNVGPSQRGALGAHVGAPEQTDFGSLTAGCRGGLNIREATLRGVPSVCHLSSSEAVEGACTRKGNLASLSE